jgi:hypothetical protein
LPDRAPPQAAARPESSPLGCLIALLRRPLRGPHRRRWVACSRSSAGRCAARIVAAQPASK